MLLIFTKIGLSQPNIHTFKVEYSMNEYPVIS